MSLSIGGFHPGYTHPGSMGVTSTQDFYASHYQTHVAASAAYPDYDVTGERNYWQNWVLSGMAEIPVAPAEPTYSGVCSTPSPTSVCQNQLGYTENGHSLNQWQNYQLETQMPPLSEMRHYDTYTNSFGEKCYRRRTSANKKERRRTVSINNAFTNLRGSIPNVPSDTKLSKIKTLRLAISYISYLNEVLEKGDEKLAQTGFKADISRKRERRTEATTEGKKLCTSDACDSDDSSGSSISSNTGEGKKGRTGWPQHVWASELKSSPQ